MKKIAVIFGSSSNEHDVSIVSASSIIKNLNHEKYTITPVYLDHDNKFFEWTKPISEINILPLGTLPKTLTEISDILTYFRRFDLVFIMIHGKNGEDGLLSAVFDFLKIKYLANSPSASITTMDKILTKIILETNGLKTAPYLAFTKYNHEFLYQDTSLNFNEVLTTINTNLKYPLFVKPANSGSSIGVTKVLAPSDLENALNTALATDNRILVEEKIQGQEIECGLLEQNNEVIASSLGIVKSAEDFYTFTAKYTNIASKTEIPALISPEKTSEIQQKAIKIFKILNCHGYSRCDFFLKDNGEIIFNEINTIPGFTTISMYPKLFEDAGLKYQDLLDILITEALKRE